MKPIFLFLALVFASCATQNPVEPEKPTNVRLYAQYSIEPFRPNGEFQGAYIISIFPEVRTDIESVEIRVYQSRPPTENSQFRFPYFSTFYSVLNSQKTIDSLVVIGNPN